MRRPFMQRLASIVLRARLLIVLVVSALTVLGALSIWKWAHIESDISKYLPQDDPVVIRFNQAGERFGGVAVGIVGLEYEDVFHREAIEEIRTLTRAIAEIQGVSWVISLTQMDDVQKKVVEGEKAVMVGRVVDPDDLPDTPEEMDALRKYVMGKEQLVGVIVSQDARLASISFLIRKEADRVEVAKAVEDKVREKERIAKLYFSGFPFWMKTMNEMILHDMIYLVPIVSLVVILILFASFRSVRGVLLPLATVLISAVWAMGLMAALRIPITTLSNVIPVLLIALGTAYAIHMLHKVEEGGRGDSSPSSLESAMADVMLPILLAGLTTVVGFLSFLTSNLVFIRHTGTIAAFGIFSAMLVAMTFVPAVLSYLPPRRKARGVSSEGAFLDRLGPWIARKRSIVVAIAVATTALAGAFIPTLDRQFDMVRYFPEESDVRRADTMLREKLKGNIPLWIAVEGDIREPYVLQTMYTLEKYLRVFEHVHNAKSIANLIAEMNQVMVEHRSIPETARGVGNLWLNLEGKDVLAQFVDKGERHALIQAVCDTPETSTLRVIVEDVERFIDALPKRVVRIDLRQGGQKADRARRERIERVALDVSLDIRFRLGSEAAGIDREVVAGWIQAALTGETGAPEKAEIAAAVKRFMASDEADMEIEDEALVASLADSLAELALSSKRVEPKSVEAIVRSTLADQIQDDPQGPVYLARSLAVLLTEKKGAYRTRALLDRVLEKLPTRAKEDRRLVEELDGDLSVLNQPHAYLTASGDEGEEIVTLHLAQTGMHHISVNVDNRLVYSQLASLGLAAFVAMLLLMIQFRSVLAGMLGMIPMVTTIVINFGIMAMFEIDLDPATVLIASLVVGVGIDYTIHFLSRARLEIGLQQDSKRALDMTLRTAGRAILINAITVTGGQLVFLAAQLNPLHSFGILLALAMLVSALSSVTVLPAMLLLLNPRFLKRKTTKAAAEY